MNQDAVKAMLLDIQDTALGFSVVFTGKASKKVNGLYNTGTFEILLHNKNFTTDGQLIYTAIHEYTHHLEHEALIARAGGAENAKALRPARFHTADFWARFHRLLEVAGEKGYYRVDAGFSPELETLTGGIKARLEQNGAFLRELGGMLAQAEALCRQSGVRYEDYIDRVLHLPRASARALTRAHAFQVDPAIGGENMKFVASLPSPEQRKAAEAQFLAGKTPDTVRSALKKRADADDPKGELEKEKRRLERTIEALTARLRCVEENLARL